MAQYKNLYAQIVDEIERRMRGSTPTASIASTVSTSAGQVNSITSTALAEAIATIVSDLGDLIEPRIISGLDATASYPASEWITITSGTATSQGKKWTLSTDMAVKIPFDSSTYVFYVVIVDNAIQINKTHDISQCEICKVVVPKPGTTIAVVDDKPEDGYDAYIISAKDVFYDEDDQFDDASTEKLRDAFGDIAAETIFGNLKLSEGLKITNVQGSLEMDSAEMRILYKATPSAESTTVAKFNRNGTFFYDNLGIEVAKFSIDEARVGNILVTKNSIQSADYVSGLRGFQILDAGNAEFEDVSIRGQISSSVFGYDKISAVGGRLLVSNASVLAEDINATQKTIKVKDSVFSINDVLRIKDGNKEEYIEVVTVDNAPTYNVNRALNSGASLWTTSWDSGVAVVSTASSGSGFISLDAASARSPYIDINLRNSGSYDDWVVKARLGNLAGITDSLYGNLTGYGLYSDNVYLRGKLYAPDIKTAITGSRAEMNTCCLTMYDSAGCQVFNVQYSGTTAGDVTIGDLQSQYIFWNNALDKITIKSATNGTCFELSDGSIIANTVTLKDPNCECCYSYLNSGQWYFHDELGNSNPYVKRLCAGEANTGAIVCLPGWKGQPYIQIGIKDLAAYDPNYAVNCQKWCVYYCNAVCYVNSPIDYGWCFEAHASLYKASGIYDEATQDVALDTSVLTHSDAYWTRARSRFLLWCFTCASSTCYGYGVLCYQIKYKCCLAGCAWTCCSYTYTQPHDSTIDLKTCQDICNDVCFGTGGCWELQLNCLSLTWLLTTLSTIVTCCCSRNINTCYFWFCWGAAAWICDSCSRDNTYYCNPSCALGDGTYGGGGRNDIFSSNALINGDNPSNVYCAYLCLTGCTTLRTVTDAVYYDQYEWTYHRLSCSFFCLQICGCSLQSNILCHRWDYINPCEDKLCDYTGAFSGCFNLNSVCSYYCLDVQLKIWMAYYACEGYGVCWACSTGCVCTSYLVQCYCTVPADCTCEYERLWSLKDYSETQTVLDPSGVLNYLAVGYS